MSLCYFKETICMSHKKLNLLHIPFYIYTNSLHIRIFARAQQCRHSKKYIVANVIYNREYSSHESSILLCYRHIVIAVYL